MKKFIILISLAYPVIGISQTESKKRFGIKAGYNNINMTNLQWVNGSNSTGFHFGIWASSPSSEDKTLSESGELLFSKQGYNYKINNSNGRVDLYYLTATEMGDINIAEIFKLQVGLQLGYLLNAKADSNNTSLTGYNKTTYYYNRFDFCFVGGAELNPVSGLVIGARYIAGLNSINKKIPVSVPVPPFMPASPNTSLKNNLLQLYLGFRF